MGWKATGQPTVRKQRDKWVVRVDGIDTATAVIPNAGSVSHQARTKRCLTPQ